MSMDVTIHDLRNDSFTSRGRAMVWKAVYYYGTSKLVFVASKINTEYNKRILVSVSSYFNELL